MIKLTPLQQKTLDVIKAALAREEPFVFAAVARELGISRETLYDRVYRIEAKGWIRLRDPSPPIEIVSRR